MTQPVGTAEGDRLVDGRQPERLTGMNREARVVITHVLECIQVPGWRVAGLRAGDVESDNSLVPEPDRQLCDLPGHCGVPHRGDQTADGDGLTIGGTRLLAGGEARQNGVDDVVERQPAADVQLRREPHLGIDHRIGGQVLRAFEGDPIQGLGSLHHRHRVRKRFQVALQRAAVRLGAKPTCQRVDVSCRQVVVSDLPGNVQHGGRPQPAVEVIVQQRLGG